MALLLAGPAAYAQHPAPDSLPPAPRHWRWVPSLSLDNRNPLEADAAVRVIGLNVGVMPRGGRYRLGLAAYTLRRNYTQYYTYSGKGKNQKIKDTFTPALSLLYFTPNFAYTFFRSRFVELSIPIDIGLGRSYYTVTDENGMVTTDSRGVFMPAEIGLGVLLKPTRWVGVSGGIGYRRSLMSIDYREDFDGWYYAYRLNLFVGPIWHDVRGYCRRRVAWRQAHPRLPAPSPEEEANP